MAIAVERVTATQAETVMQVEEGQFVDVKSRDIAPNKLTRTVSAFANSDGGDLYVGIAEGGSDKHREWIGFLNQEAANGHVQIFEQLFPLGRDFQYEFLRCDERRVAVALLPRDRPGRQRGLPVGRRRVPAAAGRGGLRAAGGMESRACPSDTPFVTLSRHFSGAATAIVTPGTIDSPKQTRYL